MNVLKVRELWNKIEITAPPPRFVTKINELNFATLKSKIDLDDFVFIKKIIGKLYSGEAFIVRAASSPNLKNIIIELAREYDKKMVSSFHKMLDGSPNFHRIIDNEVTQKYSLYAIKHSYYFYNWNAKLKLETDFKRGVYKHWRYIKYIAGNSKYAFENNIPSQGQIDRLQIVNYPHGGGELRAHEDPRKNQRVVSGLIMSKVGVDFESGGFYFIGEKNNKINIERQLNIGDAVMFYGSIIHGVQPVDPHKKIDWNSYSGRWFIGMFINDSDHVLNRVTAKDLTNSTSYNLK